MTYFPDIVYKLVGRDDRVATVFLLEDSQAYRKYGTYLTVLFEYNPHDREEFEKRFVSGEVVEKHNAIKARMLGSNIRSDLAESLKTNGLDTVDIASIVSFSMPNENLYHSDANRSIKTLNIRFASLPNGGDFEWIYGFLKMKLSKGIGLSPDDYDLYLALKIFYEANKITIEEQSFIQANSGIKNSIELKQLEIKGKIQNSLSPEEEIRFAKLFNNTLESKHEILTNQLRNGGIRKDELPFALLKVSPLLFFDPITVNAIGKRAIYLDFEGYTHICLRHVREFDVIPLFSDKDKFSWEYEEIVTVVKGIIQSVDEEIQNFWVANPTARFSKYGSQSLYYEGDYYTFHIEPDGRISTFHRNRK